ncbi:DNA polymerase III subunit gamma/tau [Thalassotalea insulae]|uniref:DNA polymerase III subunit gamma/tau n=1 Tax=Thalassotalea insulae TaxID=2056778 RepID=A0ABQ6GRX1_9GAMM|nr:DNA polymerase III subunit gamma/tau [Thalassotalea insulae]GLX77372.1 DNA polymerase III subunit gamma/tau [Thalassotalea insulae]
MSYQVLARKWRPKNFQQLMGQEHVVTVLTNAIVQQRLHHAYLFTGTRGVGKTTIARIFAKSLNCEQGITAEPCGECQACLDIDQGRFVDLLEIDAASRTKVDDTREILDNVQYAPSRGRYKVYLIDEVHMLSRSSFNALLKTLEEPPEHVKFILATTDPQKLPVTVLSRCLQFHLKALSVVQISQQLKTILAAEQVEFDELAISLLAKAARGSMRDSLSLTDQAIAQGQGHIIAANVQQMLGGVDHHWIYKILILLLKQDAKGLMALSLEIASYAPNYGRLLAELIQLLHQVAMAQVVGSHFDLSPEHNQLLEKFCQSMSPEDVQLYYQIAVNGRKDLPYAADEQAAFDMVLLRLLAFKPQTRPLIDETVQLESQTPVSFDDIELPDTDISHQDTSGEKALDESTANSASVESQAPVAIQDESELSSVDVIQSEEQTTSVTQVPSNTPVIDTEQQQAELSNELTQEMLAIEEQAQQQSAQAPTQQPPVLNQPEQQMADMASDEPEVEVVQQSTVEHEHQQAEFCSQHANEQHAIAEPGATSSADNSMQNSDIAATKNPTGIEAILANRNMLRSRKKALEQSGKKPKDAEARQDKQQTPLVKKPAQDVPDIELVPDQFTPEIIDPSVIKKANQVDKWANMIDAMALNGRLRQLALNATIEGDPESDSLVLLLNQSTKHLKSDAAHQQLQQFVSQYFARPMQVEIKVVEQTVADPAQIQSHINDKRYDYAKELLLNDEFVIALQQQFQAELDEKTIVAR